MNSQRIRNQPPERLHYSNDDIIRDKKSLDSEFTSDSDSSVVSDQEEEWGTGENGYQLQLDEMEKDIERELERVNEKIEKKKTERVDPDERQRRKLLDACFSHPTVIRAHEICRRYGTK